jgi:DNA invertase Pin-like site-specific DNA recombinase
MIFQRQIIQEYLQAQGMITDDIIEIELSGKRCADKKKTDQLLERFNKGDTLIVSDLSRLGRSSVQVINLVNELVEKEVRFIAAVQRIDINGETDLTSRVMVNMLSLFVQLERDLVSQRTKQGLAERKAAGVKLGRPRGSTGKSKLDPHKEQIASMLKHRAPLSYIARVYGVTWPTVANFIKTRKLEHIMNKA